MLLVFYTATSFQMDVFVDVSKKTNVLDCKVKKPKLCWSRTDWSEDDVITIPQNISYYSQTRL